MYCGGWCDGAGCTRSKAKRYSSQQQQACQSGSSRRQEDGRAQPSRGMCIHSPQRRHCCRSPLRWQDLPLRVSGTILCTNGNGWNLVKKLAQIGGRVALSRGRTVWAGAGQQVLSKSRHPQGCKMRVTDLKSLPRTEELQAPEEVYTNPPIFPHTPEVN